MRKLSLMGLFLVTAGTVAAFAAQLQVTDVKEIGGTPAVDVITPDSDDAVEEIAWVFDPGAWGVTSVDVTWTPRNTAVGDGVTYAVHVGVYSDNSCTVQVASGAALGEDPGGSPTTTQVALTPAVDPADVECVKVAILEE